MSPLCSFIPHVVHGKDGAERRQGCGDAGQGQIPGGNMSQQDLEGSGPLDDDPLRVIVVDDDPLARRMLRDVLQEAGIVVIAEAGGGREAIELSNYYKPDVVVMDLVMPGIDGIAATRQIVDQTPEVRVVMLTSSDSEEVGMMTLRAGASGFLCKSVGVDALPRALRCAKEGEAVVSRALTMRLIEGMRRVREDGAGMRPIRSPLTPREWEVLDLLCQERSTDDIADTLVLSVETVRSHIKSVLRKLGVRSRQEAIKAAGHLRSGLVTDVLVAEAS
jgi:NarL family two-component system response regulator LiaR